MKILLTGCTPKQCRPQPDFQYFSFFQALYDALVSRGHEVDWTHVKPGQDLSEYDCALIGLHVLGSNAARRFKYGAFWAASQLPHIPILQDWRVRKTLSTLRSKPQFWVSKHLTEREYEDWFKPSYKHAKELERVRYVWEFKFPKLMLPLFPWGRPEMFQEIHHAQEIVTWNPDDWYDPAEWYDNSPPVPDAERKQAWTCASLSDVDEWVDAQRLTWPTNRIYADKSTRGASGTRMGGWKMTPEPEIVENHYKKEWGVLIPSYGSSCGVTGWWRGRYKLAAWCGNVALTDSYDCPLTSYTSSVPALIEQHDSSGLRQIADAQKAELTQYALTREESAIRLEMILENLSEPIRPPGYHRA